jgi:flagellin
MAVVNTNVGASVAQAALAKNARELDNAMTQLSTGKKINSASDDASGLAITNRMTSQINGLGAAIKNANDAISMIQTAEGALDEITDMLQRMRELAVQAGTGTMTSSDRTYLQAEFAQLRTEIDRIADNTEWNGNTILDGTADGSSGSSVSYQIGVDGGQTISVSLGNMTDGSSGSMNGISASKLTMTTGVTGVTGVTAVASVASATDGSGAITTTGVTGVTAVASVASVASATAAANASAAITALDTAIEAVSNQRSTFGAGANRLEHAVDNLTNVKTNAEASRSRILDTDYAEATAELARTQIIQQASTAMLAQANQLPQTVLALLQ